MLNTQCIEIGFEKIRSSCKSFCFMGSILKFEFLYPRTAIFFSRLSLQNVRIKKEASRRYDGFQEACHKIEKCRLTMKQMFYYKPIYDMGFLHCAFGFFSHEPSHQNTSVFSLGSFVCKSTDVPDLIT